MELCTTPLQTVQEQWRFVRLYQKLSLDSLETVAYCILSPLSVLAGVLLLAQFYLREQMRHPPGELILWQLLSQFCVDLTWSCAGWMFMFWGRVEDNTFCLFLAIASLYGIFVSCGYGVSLTFEVFYKIKRPLNLSFGTRVAVYHILTHLQAFIITLTASASSSLGLTDMHTCFYVMNDSLSADWVTMLPLALFFCYMLLSFLILFYLLLRAATARRKGERTLLWNHYVYALASLVISMAFPGYLLPYVWTWATGETESASRTQELSHSWSRVAVVAGPAAGLALSLIHAVACWLAQKQASEKPMQKVAAATSAPLLDSMPRIYESMLQECVMTTLLSLYLLFRQKDKEMRASSSTESGSTADEGKEQETWKFTNENVEVGGTAYLEDAKRWFRVLIREYRPGLYNDVRQLQKVTEEELARALHPVQNESTLLSHSGNKGGKSNAFIYFTHDRKFILKTLSYSEVKFLLRHQLQFNRHFRRKPGGFSYIAKILGLFKISDCARSIYLVVMENIVNPDVAVSMLFDLKGSRKNRMSLEGSKLPAVSELSSSKVYKDLDFEKVLGHVQLPNDLFQDFQYQLMKDVSFLEELKVMDYSFLMAFTDNPARGSSREMETADGKWRLYVGIIDFLQTFNSRKKLEVLSNRLQNPKSDPMDISCVNQHLYADRFLQFMWRIVKPQSIDSFAL